VGSPGALNAARMSTQGLQAACPFDLKCFARLGVSVYVPGGQADATQQHGLLQ